MAARKINVLLVESDPSALSQTFDRLTGADLHVLAVIDHHEAERLLNCWEVDVLATQLSTKGHRVK